MQTREYTRVWGEARGGGGAWLVSRDCKPPPDLASGVKFGTWSKTWANPLLSLQTRTLLHVCSCLGCCRLTPLYLRQSFERHAFQTLSGAIFKAVFLQDLDGQRSVHVANSPVTWQTLRSCGKLSGHVAALRSRVSPLLTFSSNRILP